MSFGKWSLSVTRYEKKEEKQNYFYLFDLQLEHNRKQNQNIFTPLNIFDNRCTTESFCHFIS